MRSLSTREWMIAATVVPLGMVLAIGVAAAPGERLAVALRATARWSFLWFSLASTGGALVTLFGARFQALARRARDFGLAFASAHLVHVGLVAILLYLSATPFPRWKLIFFGLGVFWVYSLALLSIRRTTEFLGIDPRTWRIVRSMGVEYIALVFLFDFAPKPFYGGVSNRLIYLPFFVMAIGGPLLRLAAAAKRLAGRRRVAAAESEYESNDRQKVEGVE
jgi:hypothetical protein